MVALRIPGEMLRQIEATIARRNFHSPEIPWNRTDFILSAIREKLGHMSRSRRPSRRRKTPLPPSP